MQRCMGCMKEFSKDDKVCPECGYEVGTKPKSKNHLPCGTQLAQRYILGKVISCNKYTVTYLAWDEKLCRSVTVKEFFCSAFLSRAEDETAVTCYDDSKTQLYKAGKKKMLDEGAAISKFSSDENVINVYDCFEANGTSYMCMECIQGSTLSEYLEQQGGRLEPKAAVELILPVANALAGLHGAGIIHADITPESILVTEQGKVKLIDFGSTMFNSLEDPESSFFVTAKVGFTPKEKYSGKSCVAAYSDVYGLCAVLYWLITGHAPSDCLLRDSKPLKSFKSFGINGFTKIEKAVSAGLVPSPEERTPDVEKLIKQLRKACDDTTDSDDDEPIVPEEPVAENPEQTQNKDKKSKVKKLIGRILVALTVLAFIGVVVTVFVIRPWAPVRTGNFSEKSGSVDDVLDIYSENVDVWLPEDAHEEESGYRFGFADLDGDGVCELITSCCAEDENVSINRYYTVNLEEETVEEIKAPPVQAKDGFDWAQSDKFRMLQNKENAEIVFWCYDSSEEGDLSCESYGLLSLTDGEIKAETICTVKTKAGALTQKDETETAESETTETAETEETESEDEKEYYFYPKSSSEVQKVKYETYCKVFYKKHIDLNVKLSFVDVHGIKDMDRHELRDKLLETYNMFSCDVLIREEPETQV